MTFDQAVGCCSDQNRCDLHRGCAGNFVDFNTAYARYLRFKNKAERPKTLTELGEILAVFLSDGTAVPLEMFPTSRALRGETATGTEYRLQRKVTGESWIGSYSFAPIREKVEIKMKKLP